MRPLNVLVVDDDTSIRSMLRIAFSVEEGIGEIREAASGVEALAHCGEFAPDVIFLDYWMPGMDGATAAMRIRTQHPKARIIAFSGVLEAKPDWADDLYIKGELPNLEVVIDLARGEGE